MATIICFIFDFIMLGFFNACGAENPIISTSLIALTSLAIFADILHSKQLKPFFNLLLGIYLTRIGLLYAVLYRIIHVPQDGSDTEGYYYSALNIARFGYSDWVEIGGLFPRLFAQILKIIGHERLFATYIILLFSFYAICILVFILNNLDLTYRTRLRIVGIVGFLPSFAGLSVIFLRESLIILLNTISIYYFTEWYLKNRNKYFVYAIIFSLGSSAIHAGGAALLIAYTGILAFYDNTNKVFKMTNKHLKLLITYTLIFIVLFMSLGQFFFTKFVKYANAVALAQLGNQKKWDDGGASYDKSLPSGSIPAKIISIPIRMAYFLFSPLPWQWRGLKDMVGFIVSSLFYLIACFYCLRIIYRYKQQGNPLLVLLFFITLVSSFIFGFGVTNFGTAMRHRDKFVSIYAIILAISWDIKFKSRKRLLKIR